MRLIGLAVVFAACLTVGTPAGAEPSAEKLALARRYAAALHMENIMGTMMNNLMPIVVERTAKARGLAVTPELKEAMGRAAERSARHMTPRMLEVMTPALAESFSEDELKAAVAYYESAAAQSLLAKMPAYTARTMPQLAELMPAMEADLQARICEEIGCETKK
jgi:hypothetical protein